MRLHKLSLLLGVAVLAACGQNETVAPNLTQPDTQQQDPTSAIEIVPEYAASFAATVDGAGVAGSALPDSLKLTAEQLAAIEKVHAEFKAKYAADIERLKEIEKAARAARDSGKSRADVLKVLEAARPILEKLDAAYAKLRQDVYALYTRQQRDWIEKNQPRLCRDGGPLLSEEQLTKIRTLRGAFETANREDINTIRNVVDEARKAREEGKSEEQIKAILAKADAARERVRAASKKLNDDIMAVLTPAQREAWCVRRGAFVQGGLFRNG